MKFTRTNWLTGHITLFRTHYFKIVLRYEYDFGGPDMAGMEADLSELEALGDVQYQVADLGPAFTITVTGRLYMPVVEDVYIKINLPVTAPTGNTYIEDYLPIRVRNEYFWSKNPIRIPLKEQPAAPLIVHVERKYQSGEFEEVATLKIADIQDENGHYIEAEKILDSILDRNACGDFTSFWQLDAVGEYRHSITRFHIGHAASLIEDSGSETDQPPNYFYAIQGGQDPSIYFKTGDKWGLADEVMSWRPANFTQRTGNGDGALLPYSVLQRGFGYEMVVGDGDPVNMHQYETIVQVVASAKYVFLLMRYRNEHTRIYATRADFHKYEVVAEFDNVVPHSLVVADGENEWLPTCYLLSNSGSRPSVRRFTPGFWQKPSVEVVYVNTPFAGVALEWVIACEMAGGEGIAGVVIANGDQMCAIKLSPFTDITLDSDLLFPPVSTALKAAIAYGTSLLVLGWHNGGVSFHNYADGTPTYVAMDVVEVLTAIQFYRKDEELLDVVYFDTGYIYSCRIDVATEAVIESESEHYPMGSVLRPVLQKDRLYAVPAEPSQILVFDMTEDQPLAISYTEHSVDPVRPLKIPLPAWPKAHLLTYEEGGNPVVQQGPEAGGEITEYVAVAEPLRFFYKQFTNGSTGEPYTLTLPSLDESKMLRYKADGRYNRQMRYLVIKTMAGAYEVLFLEGEKASTFATTKALSNRYVDDDLTYPAGMSLVAWIEEANEELVIPSGYMSKAEYQYFEKQIGLSKECYLVDGLEWMPVIAHVKDGQPTGDAPDLFTMSLSITPSWKLLL